MTKVATIIINFNTADQTKKCLNSLAQIDFDSDIVVVENSSTNRSQKITKLKHSRTKLVSTNNNLGFSGGVNFALKSLDQKKYSHFLLLNNDTQISDRYFLTKLISPGSDITSAPALFSRNNKALFGYGGTVDWLFGRNYHFESRKLISDPPAFDYLSGVCLLIKRKVIEQIGLLDDNYFLYYEDADYCLRAREKGFRLKMVTNTSFMHELSASSKKLGIKKIRHLASSHLRFCKRHLPLISSPFYLSYNLFLRAKT